MIFSYIKSARYALFAKIPMLANALKDAFQPIGLNIINNNQKPYQSVFHYHIHLVPRYIDDTFNIQFPHLNYTQEELVKIKESIQSNIK